MPYRIRGTVLPDGDVREVFVVDGRFTFEGVEDAETLLDDCVLLPGLVDVHAHLTLSSPASPDAAPREQAEVSAAAHLDAGVLLIREPGSPEHASRGIGADAALPRVITSGRFLAPPGHEIPGLELEVSPDALPDAAESEFRVGGGWVKVIGDTFVPGPGITQTYPLDALRAAAERIHSLGGRLAIHAMSAEAVADAVEAGFDSIEHGTFMEQTQLAQLADRDIAWTPTRSIDALVRSMVRDMNWPTAAIADMDRGFDQQPQVVAAAVDAGVTILAGTDAGAVPHGQIREEITLLLDAGVPADVALGAASWTARSFLGLPGIEEGAPADLVAYRDDPRTDVRALRTPTLRMLGGRLIDEEERRWSTFGSARS
jgi:imidazolonepropionase-like amidohydrolase